jgi:hypothetical protein
VVLGNVTNGLGRVSETGLCVRLAAARRSFLRQDDNVRRLAAARRFFLRQDDRPLLRTRSETHGGSVLLAAAV